MNAPRDDRDRGVADFLDAAFTPVPARTRTRRTRNSRTRRTQPPVHTPIHNDTTGTGQPSITTTPSTSRGYGATTGRGAATPNPAEPGEQLPETVLSRFSWQQATTLSARTVALTLLTVALRVTAQHVLVPRAPGVEYRAGMWLIVTVSTIAAILATATSTLTGHNTRHTIRAFSTAAVTVTFAEFLLLASPLLIVAWSIRRVTR